MPRCRTEYSAILAQVRKLSAQNHRDWRVVPILRGVRVVAVPSYSPRLPVPGSVGASFPSVMTIGRMVPSVA